MSFSVPEYTKGEKLFISLFSGADSIEYAGGKYKPGEMIELDTASGISIKVIPLQAVYVKAFKVCFFPLFAKRSKVAENSLNSSVEAHINKGLRLH